MRETWSDGNSLSQQNISILRLLCHFLHHDSKATLEIAKNDAVKNPITLSRKASKENAASHPAYNEISKRDQSVKEDRKQKVHPHSEKCFVWKYNSLRSLFQKCRIGKDDAVTFSDLS